MDESPAAFGYFRVKAARQGMKRDNVADGNQSRLRRPFIWKVVKEVEGCAVGLGERFSGRAWRHCNNFCCRRRNRLREMEEDHKQYSLKRGDIELIQGGC